MASELLKRAVPEDEEARIELAWAPNASAPALPNGFSAALWAQRGIGMVDASDEHNPAAAVSQISGV